MYPSVFSTAVVRRVRRWVVVRVASAVRRGRPAGARGRYTEHGGREGAAGGARCGGRGGARLAGARAAEVARCEDRPGAAGAGRCRLGRVCGTMGRSPGELNWWYSSTAAEEEHSQSWRQSLTAASATNM